MADQGFVETTLRQVPDETTRRAVTKSFEHVLKNIRFGVPEHQERAVNLQTYFLEFTTGTSTGEFTIAHGLGQVPHMALPVLDVSQPGAQLVPLEVTRAADIKRLYLKSTSTSAACWLLVE